MKINIVMVEPEIPQNTGNIARTCAATGAKLHLVKPLGFEINDKHLKRAGLDYWDKLEIEEHENLEAFLNRYAYTKDRQMKSNFFLASTKSKHTYSDMHYPEFEEVFFLFGKETKGLPEDLLQENMNRAIRIPMKEGLRSLNLSNSVAIVVYEALRQNHFENLQQTSNYFA